LRNEEEIKLIVPKREGQISAMFSRGGPREGAGRKGIGETRKVSVTLPGPAWEELDRRCAEQRMSRSELIRELILVHFADKTGKRVDG
jgi:hypothetical protein